MNSVSLKKEANIDIFKDMAREGQDFRVNIFTGGNFFCMNIFDCIIDPGTY